MSTTPEPSTEKSDAAKAPGTTLVIKEKGAGEDGKSRITVLNYRGMTHDGKAAFFVSTDGATMAFANSHLRVGPVVDGKISSDYEILHARLRQDGGLFYGKIDSSISAEVRGAKADQINAFAREATELFRAGLAAKAQATEAAALSGMPDPADGEPITRAELKGLLTEPEAKAEAEAESDAEAPRPQRKPKSN